MKYICPKCQNTEERPANAVRFSGIRIRCSSCGTAMKGIKVKRGRTDAQRRSQDQERRASKAYRMRQQPGSGNIAGFESDLRKRDRRRLEAKETTSKSYTLRLSSLLKLEKETRGTEMPIFLIEFQCVHPFKSYEVLPAGTLEALIQENDELRRRLEVEDTHD